MSRSPNKNTRYANSPIRRLGAYTSASFSLAVGLLLLAYGWSLLPLSEGLGPTYFGLVYASLGLYIFYGELKKPSWYWNDLTGIGGGWNNRFKRHNLLGALAFFMINAIALIVITGISRL